MPVGAATCSEVTKHPIGDGRGGVVARRIAQEQRVGRTGAMSLMMSRLCSGALVALPVELFARGIGISLG